MQYSSWVAALAGTAMLATSVPASAQVARFDPSLSQAAAPLVTDVQFRGGGARRFHGGGFHRGGGFHGGGFGHRGFGNRGFANRGYYRGSRGRGAAIGAGVAGLAAGALIGGALASQSGPAYGYGYGPGYVVDPGYAPQVPVGDASAYCSQRFKSYDPSSGTYLGYDGQRHPCP